MIYKHFNSVYCHNMLKLMLLTFQGHSRLPPPRRDPARSRISASHRSEAAIDPNYILRIMFRTRWPCPRLFGAFRPPRSKHVRIRFAEASAIAPLAAARMRDRFIFAQRNFFFLYVNKFRAPLISLIFLERGLQSRTGI